jgi:DNA-binding MarR family transcriptional regulator
VTDRPESGPAALGTSLLFDVFAVNQAVGRMLAAAMRDGPLTPAEYALYSAIFELEAASPTAIANRLGMRLTTFMDHLRTILERGHARRIDHPTDGRSYRVVLTAAGLAAHRDANRRFETASRAFLAALAGVGIDGERAVKDSLAAIRAAADHVVAAETTAGEDAPSRRLSGGRVG